MPYKKDGTGVIYCLISPSGRRYIGQTWHIHVRMSTYKTSLDRVKPQIKLYKAFCKYGFENFEIEILDYCFTQKQMDDAEYYWIKFYDSINTGYNIKEGGRGGKHTNESNKKNRYSNARYEYTITHPDGSITITKSLNEFCEKYNLIKQSMHKLSSGRQKIYGKWKVTREKIKGSKGHRKVSDELKERLSKQRVGKKRSKETIENIKNAISNREITDEYIEQMRQNGLNADRQKIGEKLKGRVMGEEWRRKISESNKGRLPWNTGKNLSDEHRKKISESQKGREGPMVGKKHTKEAKQKIVDSSCKYEYTIISPEDDIFVVYSLNQFCKDNNLTHQCMMQIINGKQKQHKGWTVTRKLRD